MRFQRSQVKLRTKTGNVHIT